MSNQVNEILELVSEPKKKPKPPSNWALYVSLLFSDLIFLVIDGISGFTVYLMTAWFGYGILTALAGFVPLLLWEACFVRPFASKWQRIMAVGGAVLAIGSVLIIGVCAAIVNVMGVDMQVQTAEIVTVVSLVVIAATHAVMFIVYFYLDEGIQANQRTEQAIAQSIHRSRMIGAGGRVLAEAQGALALKRAIERQHGAEGAEALKVILGRLMEDKNGDGIPDVLQGQRQVKSYAADTETVPFRENGHDSPNS